MVSETAMDIDELIARFEMGGEWKVRQICKMTGWSRSMIYRYVAEGKIPQSSIIRRSVRGLRIRGEGLAVILKQLNGLQS